MRNGARWAAGLLLAALVAGSTALTAAAEPKGTIVKILPSDGSITVRFSATDLVPGTKIDPGSVTMTLDGQAVDVTAKPVADLPTERSAVLTIDTSDSLQAAGLAAAKKAALAYLELVPGTVRVGLVTFASRAREVVAPTRDRAELRRAIEGLELTRGTALYDAVLRSADALGDTGSRSMVLMSDGADVGSVATLADATNAVSTRDIAVTVVAVGDATTSNITALRAIAAAGGGQVLNAGDAVELSRLFASAAETLSNEVVLTAPVPESLAGRSVDVAVTGVAGGQPVSDHAATQLEAPPAAPPGTVAAPSGLVLSKGVVGLGLLALFGSFAVILIVGATSVREATAGGGNLRRRLSVYTLTGRTPVKQHETTTMLGTSAVARSAVDLAGRVVRSRDLDTVLGAKLEAAGIPLKPAEWLLIHAGLMLGTGLLFLLVGTGNLLLAVVGLAVGAVAPWVYLSLKEDRRRRAFLAQMPDVLQLMAGSLAAGYSLPQAVDSVVREGQDPVAGEFNRALVEARLGIPVEDALEGVAARLQSKDFEWVVMAIRIQREVGGNLAELLRTVADTLREREFLRRHVKALSAEGRLSAWILGCLPPVFALALLFLRPAYISPLFTDPLGIAMVVMGAVLLVVGVLWMRKIVQVEV